MGGGGGGPSTTAHCRLRFAFDLRRVRRDASLSKHPKARVCVMGGDGKGDGDDDDADVVVSRLAGRPAGWLVGWSAGWLVCLPLVSSSLSVPWP